MEVLQLNHKNFDQDVDWVYVSARDLRLLQEVQNLEARVKRPRAKAERLKLELRLIPGERPRLDLWKETQGVTQRKTLWADESIITSGALQKSSRN